MIGFCLNVIIGVTRYIRAESRMQTFLKEVDFFFKTKQISPHRKRRRRSLLERFEAWTERIIGAAIDVHRRLGPGFLDFAKTTPEPKRVVAS
jgi:hypothetical protein